MHTNERLIAQRGQKFKLTSLSLKATKNPNFTSRDLKAWLYLLEHPKHPKWGAGGWNWAQSQLSSMKKSKPSQLSSNCSKKLFSNCRQIGRNSSKILRPPPASWRGFWLIALYRVCCIMGIRLRTLTVLYTLLSTISYFSKNFSIFLSS